MSPLAQGLAERPLGECSVVDQVDSITDTRESQVHAPQASHDCSPAVCQALFSKPRVGWQDRLRPHRTPILPGKNSKTVRTSYKGRTVTVVSDGFPPKHLCPHRYLGRVLTAVFIGGIDSA